MRTRWVSERPDPKLPIVAQAHIASWWPGRYWLVTTYQADREDALRRLTESVQTGVPVDQVQLPDSFHTLVSRCDKHLNLKSGHLLYSREYTTPDDAKKGHREVLSLLAKGALGKPYKWTQWAASGGGQGIAGWVAIAVGLIAAVWTFHLFPYWWLRLPAAVLAWLVATGVVGGLWAVIRRLIELLEGIR
jgi:hypothetical protein